MTTTDSRYSKTSLGLLLIFISTILILTLIFINIILAFSRTTPDSTKDMISKVLGLPATAMILIGSICCLFAPPETRAKPYISISVVLSLLAAFILNAPEWILENLLSGLDFITALRIFVYMVYFALIAQMTAMFFFLLFCRQLADHLEQKKDRKRASDLITTGITMVLIVAGIVIYAITRPTPAPGVRRQDDIAMVLGLILMGVSVAFIIWLISLAKLLFRLREATANPGQSPSKPNSDASEGTPA